MSTDDLKTHALTSSQDFYALLSLPESAQETEIRRAYRKTALKYHPDKVGVANQEALDKFHLLQIAYDVLSDPQVKELYDNARRARQAREERHQAFEGRRKWMKEDLERREGDSLKRKREEGDAEVEFERELRRLAEDGKRRRREREEVLRREAVEMEVEEGEGRDGEGRFQGGVTANANGEVEAMDRSITLRFPPNEETSRIDKDEIRRRFERFGPIDEVVLREKKIKLDSQKHRQPYIIAVIAYKSVVGAHAAATDFVKVSKLERAAYSIFSDVGWAAGKPPDFIPSATMSPPSPAPETPVSKPARSSKFVEQLNTPIQNGNGLKKVPSFGSFKGTPVKAGQNSPSLDEITMIRLKNAERRRMEEKIRREEAALDADAQAAADDAS